MDDEPQSAQAQPETEPVEPCGARVRRHGHRTGLYAWAFLLVALLVVVIALAESPPAWSSACGRDADAPPGPEGKCPSEPKDT